MLFDLYKCLFNVANNIKNKQYLRIFLLYVLNLAMAYPTDYCVQGGR